MELGQQVQRNDHAEMPIQNSQSHSKRSPVCNKSYSTHRRQHSLRDVIHERINKHQNKLEARPNRLSQPLPQPIIRKIVGPVNIDNMWRTRNKMEIDKLTEGAGIVRFIKAQRIKWLGHVQRRDQARPTRKLLEWKPMGIRPVGRPRQRWQEDVMEDLKKLKVKNWKERAKDRRIWRDLAEKAKTRKEL